MPRKLTTDEFIQRSIAVHGNKYGYDLVEYKSSKEKVAIICEKHGVFFQTPNCHLLGQGCPHCSGNVPLNYSSFLQKARTVHGDRYDYPITEILNGRTKIIITCKRHGNFEQTPYAHLAGQGCPKCGIESRAKKRRKPLFAFLESATAVHGNDYDYSRVNYINNKRLVEIVCPKHGPFFQSPHNHILERQGCPVCGIEKCKKSNTYTTEEFVELCKKVHGDKYDYSKVHYVFGRTKVVIGCRIHGDFLQSPNNHLNGAGCPRCSESKGEKIIGYLLQKGGLQYETEKIFPECKDKRVLKFDFYIPELNMCIEYQGLQHYEMVPSFNDTEEKFKSRQRRDQIKRDYCASHGIKLIEIRYDQDIEQELNKHLHQWNTSSAPSLTDMSGSLQSRAISSAM